MIKLKPLAVNVAIPLAVGALSGFLTRDAFSTYSEVVQPSFAPPPWLFPIVWTVLYILMGVSSYMIWMSKAPQKREALKIYAAQLIVNFVWPLLFFLLRGYLISFLWLLLLIMLIASMIFVFCGVRRAAGLLQLPYLLWSCFAAALNWSIYILNR